MNIFLSSIQFILPSGLLQKNGDDIGRFIRIFDPVFLVILFNCLQPNSIWTIPLISVPFWAIIFLLSVTILPSAGIYKSYRHKSLGILCRELTTSWITIFCLIILFTYFNKSTATYSRVATSSWFLISWLWLISCHIGGRMVLRKLRENGFNSRLIIYWGDPKSASNFANEVNNNSWLGFKIYRWFSPVKNYGKSVNLPRCSGGIDELEEWTSNYSADYLIFNESFNHDQNISMDRLLRIFGNTSMKVLYAPDWSRPTMRFTYEAIGNQHCIEVWGKKQPYFDRLIKRLFDLILTTVGLIIIFPLLIVIAVSVKLTSVGPIIFVQERYGLDGKKFLCYKFRTMISSQNQDQSVIQQATMNDKRVTNVGRFLRKWSLDELPQLLNVLIGDMSLVGPRPHAVQHNELYRKKITGYMQRHAFKPGITGLAQVKGWRGETQNISEMESRINADLEYQRNWSLFLDIKILVSTFITISSDNAY